MGECEGRDLIPLSTLSSSDIENTDSSTNTQDSPQAEPKETRKQKCKKHIILSSLFMAYLLVSAAYSIIAPFYPQEAQKFGVGSFAIGLIIGTSELCVVVLSPVLGYFIPEIGIKFMLIAGSFLIGGSYLILGFIADMSSRLEFVVYSVLLSIVEGIGIAAYSTGMYTMATVLYPKSTGTVVGILEVGSAIGYMMGPPIGGVLYQFGGFLLPFVVIGGLNLLFIPVFIILLPNASGEKEFIPLQTVIKLLRDIPFLMLGISNILLFAALTFFDPTLAPFLKEKFNISEIIIGLIFFCAAAAYVIPSFLSGKLSDILGPRYFIVGGLIITGISYIFMGPAEFITSESYLWLTWLAICCLGIGLGFGIVPMYSDMLEIARRVSPGTDEETLNGVVSGLVSSTLSIGEFIGPVLGGGLAQFLSFKASVMIFGQALIAKGLLLLGISLIDRFVKLNKTSAVETKH